MRIRLVSALAIALFGCSPQPTPYDYESVVKSELRDPESAQFSDVTENVKSACGFVNSKNGYGGYAGRQPFVAVENKATLIEATAEASTLVNGRCLEPTKAKINNWLTDQAVKALK